MTASRLAEVEAPEWGEKQRCLIEDVALDDARTRLVSGPFRAGKSLAGVYGFMDYVCQWAGRDFILASHSQKQLDAAVLENVKTWCDLVGLGYRRVENHYVVEAFGGRGSNRLWTLLGSNASSVNRARSFTGAGALIDEATLCPEDFVKQLVTRCSVPGSKIVALTNPDSPHHWLHREWIEGGGAEHDLFEMRDNPSLSEEYVKEQEGLYHGAALRRGVFGEWVTAEGAIYPFVPVDAAPATDAVSWVIAADWASSGWTHALLFGLYADGTTHVVSEYVYNGQESGWLDEIEQAERIADRLAAGRKISMAVADKSNPRFVKALGHVLKCGAFKSYTEPRHEVKRGCDLTRIWFEQRFVQLDPRCRETIRQLNIYRWDPRAAILGEDKPVKEDDHGCDAMRYGVWAIAQAKLRAG